MTDPQTPAPDQRPQPQYGEYAPEGWEPPEPSPTSGSASGSSPVAGTHRQAPGVPHNLGVGETRQPVTQHEVPPTAPPQGTPMGPGVPPAPAQRQGSTADRVITIVLLVIGAFGALQMALGMLTLGTQLEIIANTLGAEDFTVPAGMTVLQSVGTILVLSLYAVALIWSVQRLRAKKLTFWVPLAAGALAVILVFVCALIGVLMVPELLALSDPESTQLLFDQLRMAE